MPIEHRKRSRKVENPYKYTRVPLPTCQAYYWFLLNSVRQCAIAVVSSNDECLLSHSVEWYWFWSMPSVLPVLYRYTTASRMCASVGLFTQNSPAFRYSKRKVVLIWVWTKVKCIPHCLNDTPFVLVSTKCSLLTKESGSIIWVRRNTQKYEMLCCCTSNPRDAMLLWQAWNIRFMSANVNAWEHFLL
jgi:hypothetical protein